jgi:glycosyltransferase involved in cell wall biosynthesis
MAARHFAIVAPRLPPQPCGVGTYAWQLQEHWPANGDTAEFIVTHGAEASRATLDSIRVTQVSPKATSLNSALEKSAATDVLLHYAGRAYQRFGAPCWLQRGVAEWQSNDSNRRVHVIFHELPAVNAPFFSKHGIANWLSERVAARLTKSATTVITNSRHHAERLRRWRDRDVPWLPVASNIPPPPEVGADNLSTRQHGDFAMFGLPFTRLQIIQNFREDLRRWSESKRLKHLHLIGPRDDAFSHDADALIAELALTPAIVEHGELETAAVSRLLMQCELCLSNATSENWSKSGTLMAAIAHGCAPVVIRDLGAGAPRTMQPRDVDNDVPATECAAAARRWYEQHATWDIVASRTAQLIIDSAPPQ